MRNLTIQKIIDRKATPKPWAEGEKIPWNQPDFSERMLAEHLDQSHDMASRRSKKIDRHVHWIHNDLLGGLPGRILDLGCGPGFYANRLAALGHKCVGIDFSPASIRHAKQEAESKGLNCQYRLADVRMSDFGDGFDLVMMVFGEFNVFRQSDAEAILRKAKAALRSGGLLLLEAHPLAAVKMLAAQRRSWHSATSGLFSERPHLWMQECFWDDESQTTTQRFFVIEADGCNVSGCCQTFQGYSDDQYVALLGECGFAHVTMHLSLTGDSDDGDLFVIVARE